MTQHPTIEIRLFNPFANRAFHTLEFIFSLERLNHRMHNKAFVVDRELLAIGSFNVDPRSIALNTEIVILVESRQLAAQVLNYMDEGVQPQNSYPLMLETDEDTGVERLVWITEIDGADVRY